MTWTRLGDNFYDRSDLGRVSRSARLLFVEMLVYCNRELLDGAFPVHMLRRICDDPEPLALVAELKAAGVVTAPVDGVLQVDWSEQEDAETVRARQQVAADKQKRYRLRKELHQAGDHSMCDPRYCKGVTGNATGNETSRVTGLVTPSLPNPSLPVPKGQGQGQRALPASAGAPPADATGEATTRLGRQPHPFDAESECCPLPPEHPIHASDHDDRTTA